MRSQLLISVAHLPTISEDVEAKLQSDGAEVDLHTQYGLDDYVRSIQTLAQPSSLSVDVVEHGQVRRERKTRLRLRSSLRGSDSRVLGPAQDATCNSNVQTLQANADPLAWLYRQRGKENQDSKDMCTSSRTMLPQTLYPASHLNVDKPADTSKWQTCSKEQISELQRPHEKRLRAQRLQKKCRLISYSSRGANRLQKPQLPVIYEL